MKFKIFYYLWLINQCQKRTNQRKNNNLIYEYMMNMHIKCKL